MEGPADTMLCDDIINQAQRGPGGRREETAGGLRFTVPLLEHAALYILPGSSRGQLLKSGFTFSLNKENKSALL